MSTRPSPKITEAERDARRERLVKARAAHEHKAALRALDDPVRLASATRLVGVALQNGVIDAADIVTETRRIQGLPPTIEDPGTLDDIATILIGGAHDGSSS